MALPVYKHLSIVEVEPRESLTGGCIRVDPNDERLYPRYKESRVGECLGVEGYSQTRAAAVVAEGEVFTPKSVPHMIDWKVCKPRGTGIPAEPSILRPGIAT